MKLIYWHGWGYDNTFFAPLMNILSEFDAICINEGYFGAPHIPLDLSENSIGIGHSQGFSRLIQTYPGLKGYVSLNGFTQFMQTNDFSHGVSKSLIGSMVQQFQKQPDTVLKVFYDKTGYIQENWKNNRNDEVLLQNLTALRSLKVKLPITPILAITSENDLITPKYLQELCFSQINVIQDASHSLIYDHAHICADLIRKFIKNLA